MAEEPVSLVAAAVTDQAPFECLATQEQLGERAGDNLITMRRLGVRHGSAVSRRSDEAVWTDYPDEDAWTKRRWVSRS